MDSGLHLLSRHRDESVGFRDLLSRHSTASTSALQTVRFLSAYILAACYLKTPTGNGQHLRSVVSELLEEQACSASELYAARAMRDLFLHARHQGCGLP